MKIVKKTDTGGIIGLVIVSAITAIVISCLFYFLITNEYIESSENDYLAFEGTIIASASTLLGVAFTLKKTHEENEKRNVQEKRRYEDRMRAEVEPMLVYKFESVCEMPLFNNEYKTVDFSVDDAKTSRHLVHFAVECVGDKPAKKLRLQSVRVEPKRETVYSKKWKQYLLPRDSEELYIELYRLPALNTVDDCSRVEHIKIKFKVAYTDIYDNEYSQLITAVIYPRANNTPDNKVKIEYVYEIDDLPKPELKITK
ncbi:MAG: hypothetical protein KBS56_05840 [Clostridiales bacterium]|nr:hypothetical protein [Candidatus Crickella equi]